MPGRVRKGGLGFEWGEAFLVGGEAFCGRKAWLEGV